MLEVICILGLVLVGIVVWMFVGGLVITAAQWYDGVEFDGDYLPPFAFSAGFWPIVLGVYGAIAAGKAVAHTAHWPGRIIAHLRRPKIPKATVVNRKDF